MYKTSLTTKSRWQLGYTLFVSLYAMCKGEALGRSTRIRTLDPLVPNQVRYQTALHSEIKIVVSLVPNSKHRRDTPARFSCYTLLTTDWQYVSLQNLERDNRIELLSLDWKSKVLPLNESRTLIKHTRHFSLRWCAVLTALLIVWPNVFD